MKKLSIKQKENIKKGFKKGGIVLSIVFNFLFGLFIIIGLCGSGCSTKKASAIEVTNVFSTEYSYTPYNYVGDRYVYNCGINDDGDLPTLINDVNNIYQNTLLNSRLSRLVLYAKNLNNDHIDYFYGSYVHHLDYTYEVIGDFASIRIYYSDSGYSSFNFYTSKPYELGFLLSFKDNIPFEHNRLVYNNFYLGLCDYSSPFINVIFNSTINPTFVSNYSYDSDMSMIISPVGGVYNKEYVNGVTLNGSTSSFTIGSFNASVVLAFNGYTRYSFYDYNVLDPYYINNGLIPQFSCICGGSKDISFLSSFCSLNNFINTSYKFNLNYFEYLLNNFDSYTSGGYNTEINLNYYVGEVRYSTLRFYFRIHNDDTGLKRDLYVMGKKYQSDTYDTFVYWFYGFDSDLGDFVVNKSILTTYGITIDGVLDYSNIHNNILYMVGYVSSYNPLPNIIDPITSTFDLIGYATNGAIKLLDIEIFGGISLLAFVLAPLMVCLILAIIRLFKN